MLVGTAFILCATLSLGLSASGHYPNELDTGNERSFQSQPQFAVNFRSSFGVLYQFPYFRGVTSVDGETAQKIKLYAEETLSYLDELVSEKLVPTERAVMFKWPKVVRDMYRMSKSPAAIILKMYRTTNYLSPFIGYATKYVDFLLKRAKTVEKELIAANAAKDPVKLRDDIRRQIVGINEAIKMSPVAFIFDWPEGKIDGRWSEEVISELMGRLKYHGYGKILSVMDTFLSIVLGLAKIG